MSGFYKVRFGVLTAVTVRNTALYVVIMHFGKSSTTLERNILLPSSGS
jgi:hypothetical protein